VEDAQLVAGALAGNAECYDALYVRYRGRVRGLVTGMGLPESDADDQTQVILASVCRKLGSYEQTRAAFSTWVYGFVKKAVAAYWRAQSRHPVPDSLDERAEECIASDKDGPAAEYERRQVQRGVRELVCRLSPKLREPVVLYWFKEMSVAEIARLLNRPDSTVRDQLKEAMRELRALAASEPAIAAAR
jgi:RNA polymerase sigma-70 factor (ECF subfamily)